MLNNFILLLPAAVLSAVSVIANILQLVGEGQLWSWLAVLTVIAAVIFIFLRARPLLRKNFRGVWLVDAVHQTGLIDVENRADPNHRLPPGQVFSTQRARHILISGILDQLFQNYREEVREFVRHGGEAHILLIHPERVAHSLSSTWVRQDEGRKQYWRTNFNEAQIAVDAMLLEGLDKMKGFHLRFMRDLPPYFGVLVAYSKLSDWLAKGSFVRVQPLAVSKWVGRGSVVTFIKTSASLAVNQPFEYFSQDLLAQWKSADEDPDFLERRRMALGLRPLIPDSAAGARD